jgi:predicted Fe-Mo cluster-binding NifX family protein
MRICVPTEDEAGLASIVCGHFGSAPCFSLLDIDTGEVETMENGNRHHTHGQCMPVDQLRDVRFDAVVVRGMGRNALARLSEAGIEVKITTGLDLHGVLEEARTGRLVRLDPAAACGGRGYHHVHSHGHGTGA